MRINKKNFQDKEFPHELFLITRQANKIRNAFANNMSTNIKFSKAQISKIIQSGVFLCDMLGNLGKKVITDLAIPLARDDLPGLVSNLAANAIHKLEKKTSGKGAVKGGKGSTLFNLNEDINYIIKITKSLEDSNVLIDGITERVKHEIKNKRADFFLLC